MTAQRRRPRTSWGPLSRRLIYSLALWPILLSIATTGEVVADRLGKTSGRPDTTQTIFSIGWIVGVHLDLAGGRDLVVGPKMAVGLCGSDSLRAGDLCPAIVDDEGLCERSHFVAWAASDHAGFMALDFDLGMVGLGEVAHDRNQRLASQGHNPHDTHGQKNPCLYWQPAGHFRAITDSRGCQGRVWMEAPLCSFRRDGSGSHFDLAVHMAAGRTLVALGRQADHRKRDSLFWRSAWPSGVHGVVLFALTGLVPRNCQTSHHSRLGSLDGNDASHLAASRG